MRRRLRDEEGQATVEYLVVAVGIVGVVVALGALAHLGERRVLARLCEQAVSYTVGGKNPADAFSDILLH